MSSGKKGQSLSSLSPLNHALRSRRILWVHKIAVRGSYRENGLASAIRSTYSRRPNDMRVFAKKPAEISAKAVADYGRLVLKVAYRIVPNADQAQEIFLRFHAACTRGEVIVYPKAWLCRVATNVAFNARRRQRATLGIEEDTAVEDNADNNAERRLLLDRVGCATWQPICLSASATSLPCATLRDGPTPK